MTALLFGTYNAGHAANALLAGDLRRAGWTLRSCHVPLWEVTRDKDDRYFAPASLARLGARWVRAAAALARRFRGEAAGADVLLAGFNGQLDVLLLRRLAGRRPIVFAPLVTLSETLVEDRRTYARGSRAARLLARLDRATLDAADLVVLDTAAHRDWVVAELGVPAGRILVHHLGAEAAFSPAAGGGEPDEPTDPARPVRVLFYGQYLPLHGTDVIARAAAILDPSEGIEIELIGTGAARAACEGIVRGRSHVRFEDWIDYEALPARIRAADVVLGIFGDSVKARMVVPNKVWQAAQVGSPIVTLDTPAIREVFTPGESIVTVPRDALALAAAIRRLAIDPGVRSRLRRASREAAARAASPEVRARRLGDALAGLVGRTGDPTAARSPGAPAPEPGEATANGSVR